MSRNPRILLKHNEILAIIGRRGKGKTHYLEYQIKNFVRQGWPVLLVDSEHEFDHLRRVDRMIAVYQPLTPRSIDELEACCESAWKRGSMVLAIESIDMYTDPRRPLPYYLSQIVHWGRKKRGDESRGVGLIITTRRLADCNNDPFALANHWIIFNTTFDNDIQTLKKNIGEIGEKARPLKKYHYLYWNDNQSFEMGPLPPNI